MTLQPGQDHQQEVAFPEHYKRLQAIEQNVVEAVRTAAQVMGLLSQAGSIDRQQLGDLSSRFLELVKGAQDLVLQAVQNASAERSFEGTVYHNMVQSLVASEKLDALMLQLDALQQLLHEGRAASPPVEGHGTPPPQPAAAAQGGADSDADVGDTGARSGTPADALPQDGMIYTQLPASQLQQQQQAPDTDMTDAPSLQQ